jgi:hypothetical protein
MKKFLLFSSIILMISGKVNAQGSSQVLKIAADKSKMPAALKKHTRSMGCSADTLLYSYLKEVFHPTTDVYNLELMTGMNSAWSQSFELNGTCQVNGVLFWGNVYDRTNPSQTMVVKAYLYTVNASHQPMAKIDSATVTVTTAEALYTANFSSPITMSSNFAVVIQNTTSTDTLGVMTNNATTSTYGEGLAWRKTGLGAWTTSTVHMGQDAEPIIAPIVEYSISADHTVSPGTTINQGTALTFTNTSSPTAMISNRMFNFNTFASIWGVGIADSSYVYDMGDGSSPTWSGNANYTYPNPGTYAAIQLCMTGFFKQCADSKTTIITVNSTTDVAEAVSESLRLYPSPTNGLFTVETPFAEKQNLEIFNTLGERVLSMQITAKQQIDLSGTEPGIYTVVISNESKKISSQIVLTK